MIRRVQTAFLGAMLAAGLLLPAAAQPAAPARDTAPLSAAEMRALVERAIANQHRSDEALNLYERREHRVAWDSEERKKVEEDKLFRVLPTGTGTVKMALAERGRPTPPDDFRKQLQYLEQALVWALNPAESKQKQRVEKFEKKQAERRETVDAVLEAFDFTWLGRESHDGRRLVKLRLDPRPGYNAPSRATSLFTHATAVVWIEPQSAQLVRIEAELARDFSIGGGIFGKVYKGGRFVIEQAPLGNGENNIWLPVELSYDFRGRKFVFGFSLHEQTHASGYRRIGPPAQALAQIRRELNAATAAPASP